MRHDLRVGFGLELVPLCLQLAFELEIVLDDAVVDDHHAAGAVAVRVRVLLGGAAVRGPSRVADAVEAVNRLRLDRRLQVGQFPGRAPERNPLGAHQRYACRVVPAVLHLAKTVEQNGHDRFGADVADDSTHKIRFQFRVPSSQFGSRSEF